MDEPPPRRKISKDHTDESDALNLPVFMALATGMNTPAAIRALVNLLRSDEMIDPQTRDILAEIFEGTNDKLNVKLSRKKRGPMPEGGPMVAGLKKSFDRIRIGEWISNHPDAKSNKEASIAAAKAEFNITRAEAFAYQKMYRQWEKQAEEYRASLPPRTKSP